jgi:hypothetical protein
LTDIALLLPQSDCDVFSIKIQLISDQAIKQNQTNQSKINQKKSKSQSN